MVEYFVKVGIVLICIILGIVLFMPMEGKKGKKKKKKTKIIETESNELQEKFRQRVCNLEKQIASLRAEISSRDKEEKKQARFLMIEQMKVKKFQEKLSQEREWQIKEQNNMDKKGKAFENLKKELVEVQENFSKEHSHNLRFERKVKELQEENSSLIDLRRSVEGENLQLQSRGDSNRREIAILKKENARLTRKQEDESWVAKSEYQRVCDSLKKKEKELERVIRESQK